MFLQSFIFGHFHIRKSFPKREILKIEDNAINDTINNILNMVELYK